MIPDDNLLQQNIWHWMKSIKVICLVVILNLYSVYYNTVG